MIGHYIYVNLINEKNYNKYNIFTAVGVKDGLGKILVNLFNITINSMYIYFKILFKFETVYLDKFNLENERNDLIIKKKEIGIERNQEIIDTQGKISFINVKFSYCKENSSSKDINYILKDFNIIFEAKKITVISGESGSGKSRFINLIEKKL